MSDLKYKVGDKVRIKSIDWYNENKDECGYIDFGKHMFYPLMSKYCGDVFTIDYVYSDFYTMNNNDFEWTYEMIEGLVEEESEKKLSDESWRYKNIFNHSQYPQSFERPEGYIFKDENGNVINATKIVLEKKKKEYPKTYAECCEVLGIPNSSMVVHYCRSEVDYEVALSRKLFALQKLLICRDAYWKIAGEEVGLSGSWKPDFASCKIKYAITYYNNVVSRYSEVDYNSTILVFPTEEMRDAFYEAFKEDIEYCKELL